MVDEKETLDTSETGEDKTQIEQPASGEEEAATPSEEQPAEETEESTEEPVRYAGKYDSVEDLEKSYKELESKLGNYKEVEEKARAFDQLSRVKEQSPVVAPDITQFTDAQGFVDTIAYNQAMAKYNSEIIRQSQQVAQRTAREQVDTEKAERDFPYLKTDKDAADAVVAMYQSGRSSSIYGAAQRLDKIRRGVAESATQEGATKKEKEIASKMKSQTERAGAKAGEGISLESFKELSLEEKRAILEKM